MKNILLTLVAFFGLADYATAQYYTFPAYRYNYQYVAPSYPYSWGPYGNYGYNPYGFYGGYNQWYQYRYQVTPVPYYQYQYLYYYRY